MSGFYGQLAKEALGDDVSDVSEGELENMLAVILKYQPIFLFVLIYLV